MKIKLLEVVASNFLLIKNKIMNTGEISKIKIIKIRVLEIWTIRISVKTFMIISTRIKIIIQGSPHLRWTNKIFRITHNNKIRMVRKILHPILWIIMPNNNFRLPFKDIKRKIIKNMIVVVATVTLKETLKTHSIKIICWHLIREWIRIIKITMKCK